MTVSFRMSGCISVFACIVLPIGGSNATAGEPEQRLSQVLSQEMVQTNAVLGRSSVDLLLRVYESALQGVKRDAEALADLRTRRSVDEAILVDMKAADRAGKLSSNMEHNRVAVQNRLDAYRDLIPTIEKRMQITAEILRVAGQALDRASIGVASRPATNEPPK